MSKVVGIAVFGCGRIGRMHARHIARHPRARLVTVFDVCREAATAVAAEFGIDAAAGAQQPLADPRVDAVLIASPTDTHVDLVIAAVKAGKAVLCEKPIDLDVERAQACWREIAGHHPRVMIGFNRRFDPSLRALGERLRGGEIGPPELLVITSRDPAPPPVQYLRHSGGLLRDMTIHDLDMARHLAGEIIEVHAAGANLVDPDIGAIGDIDTCALTLRARSGALVQINNSRRSSYGYDQRIEVFGARGMLLAGNHRQTSVELWNEQHTGARDPVLHFFIERYREAYVAELDAFVTAVESAAPMSPDFADGIAALELAQAGQRSLATGGAVKIGA